MKRRSAPYVIGFDTEDDGQGNPFLWAFVSADGNFWTRHRDDALAWLRTIGEAQHRRGRRVQVWATNLEYDLVNLFDPSRVVELRLRFGRTSLCGATWERIDFRDTMRHVPVSVAKLGELVGLKKREERMFDQRRRPTFKQYLTRCLRDAAITYRTAVMWAKLYKTLGERPRMTLASTALNLWRSKYWNGGVRRPEPDVWNASLAAYHGGRTQAFHVGMFRDCRAIDVASMFPWAMTCAELPLPWGLHRSARAGESPLPWGLYRVRVRSATERPSLPVRTREGTVYPHGQWEAWYVGEEIIAARELGTHVEVLGGYVFAERCRPFDAYVRTMFRRKQRSRGAARVFYKLMLNALYGKFGQQGKRVEAVPLDALLRMKDPPLDWRPWNGLAIFSKDGLPPPWGNNVWAAWITARARVRLAWEIHRLAERGCRVLYCDTDSVIYQGKGGRYVSAARRVGQFEARGSYRRVLIIGKKEYALERTRGRWEAHAKGVPSAERMSYLKHGRASFVRPVRIREAARNGTSANVWRRVEKVRRRNLQSVARSSDGALPVPVIDTAPR